MYEFAFKKPNGTWIMIEARNFGVAAYKFKQMMTAA